jgi:glycosyltransferase involved in cell wall biosynthesis
MKILWVKAGKLLPVDTGGKIRSYNILVQLAKTHQVTLLSYYGGKKDPAYEAAIVRELPGSEVIYTAAPESTIRQSIDYLLRLPNAAPFAVTKFTHSPVRQSVAKSLQERRFDVAVCDFLSASLNFPPQSPVPVVLFQHNVEASLWQRMADRETNPVRKLSYRIEASKMARYERNALENFSHVIAVSDHDRDQMLAMDGACQISVVPTGVDTSRYQRVASASGTPPVVVFTGSMDWEPNVDAVEYFCHEIWPNVLAEFPDARFEIVGRNPSARVQRLASDTVVVTGTVPSVADHLRDATVVIVPLRIGGGTRLKIFEAMAMGKAMVSTSIGAEGLDVQHGRDLLLADNAGGFATGILHLLRDPALRRRYEDAAAKLAAKYDWSHIARRFAEVLQIACQGNSEQHRAATASAVRP